MMIFTKVRNRLFFQRSILYPHEKPSDKLYIFIKNDWCRVKLLAAVSVAIGVCCCMNLLLLDFWVTILAVFRRILLKSPAYLTL